MLYSFRHPDTDEIQSASEDMAEHLLGLGWEMLAEGEDGPDPQAEAIDGQWVVPLAVLKQRKREMVNELRDLHQNDTAMTPIGLVDCDEVSKTKINGLVSMATLAKGASQPFQVHFTRTDNQRIPLDADGMIGVGIAVGMHVMACHDHAAVLKDAVEAALSAEELDAVEILENWP